MQSRQAIASTTPAPKDGPTVKIPNMNPHKVRARLLGTPVPKGREFDDEAGFTLIEIMGTVAIVAVLVLSAVPQLANAMEKAKVQTLINDENILAIQISGDQSLTGNALYNQANLTASCTAIQVSADNAVKVAPNATFTGYIITGYNPGIKNYVVQYDSLGKGAIITKATQAAFANCS